MDSPWLLRFVKRWMLAALVLLAPALTVAEPIKVGSLSSEPAAEVKKFLPLASYLGKRLQAHGISEGTVVVAASIPQMAALLKERKVDLYIDSPFPSVAVSRLSGSRFFLRRWKKGIAEYHTVIFARSDSGIQRLDDLNGKMIIFEEAFSTSGYFLPKLVLTQAGFKLVPKSAPSESVGPREVGYVFSQDDENTMVWVLRGQRLVGAMDNQNYTKEARAHLDKLQVIHRTYPLPRHVVSYRADLPAALVARLKDVLLTMDQSEDGKKALHEFERTTKFDELSEQALAPLLAAHKFIDAEFGGR